MKIYIDNFPEEAEFAARLAEKIIAFNKQIDVTTFTQFFESQETQNLDNHIEISLIQSSDIIIPIITDSYIFSTPSTVYNELDEVFENPKKFLIPIIYEETNWSSVNWLVRSKALPSDGVSFSSLDKRNQDRTISELLKAIDNIYQKWIIQQSETKVVEKLIEKGNRIVFISHDHDDADFAELLKLQLEKENIIGWIDGERLKIGQDWREEIDEGITNSIALIAIMTPEARKSEYVTYEWAYAWGKGIKIFPIMLKQTQLHPRLESLQYLDFTNRVTRPWKELIKSINELV